MSALNNTIRKQIENIINEDIHPDNRKVTPSSSGFWKSLSNCGTELWLDTGDIDEASKIWSADMSGLTTNNTLINNEIQKGIYDSFIEKANKLLKDLDVNERIREIAFILNARHGLIISRIFGCKVSVELHTNLAHDLRGIVDYGHRFYSVCPDHFIVKVPYTPTGLLGARKLGEAGIPVNFTLGFSARQNLLATLVARPSFVNVFLGRIGAYIKSNGLGDGSYAGEKTTIESQKIVKKYGKNHTRQIAASIRSADQLELLAGTDVHTIPTSVANAAVKSLSGKFAPKTDSNYIVTFADNVNMDSVKAEKLWDISDNELKLALNLSNNLPATGKELVERAMEYDCIDMFPVLSEDERRIISADGKIPVHSKWSDRIVKGNIAIDTLLNLAGLASFTADQSELDTRIEGIIR
ncbi:MAG TPA: transaldolase family protein [Bacteroidales bacterium]|nr:transaldolase family protein [Bacteroidales bacterium]